MPLRNPEYDALMKAAAAGRSRQAGRHPETAETIFMRDLPFVPLNTRPKISSPTGWSAGTTCATRIRPAICR
jgi:ABC-type oligopeptide transport system substrate-binding subunit